MGKTLNKFDNTDARHADVSLKSTVSRRLLSVTSPTPVDDTTETYNDTNSGCYLL